MKKTLFRCFLVALCCVFVMGVSCPVFAATAEDSAFVVPLQTVTGGIYDSSVDQTMFSVSGELLKADNIDYMLVSFNGDQYNCAMKQGTTSDVGERLYFGNAALYDVSGSKSLPDTGEPFLWLFSSTTFSILIVDGNHETVEFGVEVIYLPDPRPPVSNSISDGVTGTIGFAGQVVSALLSPDGALFGLLPVVGLAVGLALVVWGIKKFKDCTWGF